MFAYSLQNYGVEFFPVVVGIWVFRRRINPNMGAINCPYNVWKSTSSKIIEFSGNIIVLINNGLPSHVLLPDVYLGTAAVGIHYNLLDVEITAEMKSYSSWKKNV